MPIVAAMDTAELLDQLRALSTRIQEVADRCQRLADENRSLRQQQEHLIGERSQLLAKNEQARSRVEAMISRLKSLELAALNLAHELQQLRDEQHARNRDVERTLQDLHRKLDSVLGTP